VLGIVRARPIGRPSREESRGTFGISVDAGELTDLCYVDARPFKP
jgi:hypothetical protein